MDKCREEFEQSPKTKELLSDSIYFDEKENRYKVNADGCLISVVFLNGRWEVWQEQQAKVEELEGKLKQAYEDVDTFAEAHERECGFKAQLAKDKAELQKQVDALELKLREIAGIARRARHGEYHTESGRNAGLNIAAEIEQALKGDQYDEHCKKAEDAISNGASLTKHWIEL
ncbi:hypothetical protein [Acinetobacter baumannii]